MKILTVALMALAAIGGIYLTSEEGHDTRDFLQKKKNVFEPIVNDLLKQANEILDGSKQLNSNEVRANIALLINEAKNSLIEIDVEKAVDKIKEAIKVAATKIKEANSTYENEKLNTKIQTNKKTNTKKHTQNK